MFMLLVTFRPSFYIFNKHDVCVNLLVFWELISWIYGYFCHTKFFLGFIFLFLIKDSQISDPDRFLNRYTGVQRDLNSEGGNPKFK